MLQKNPPEFKGKGIFVGFNKAGAAGIYSFTRILRRRGYRIDFYGLDWTPFNMPVDVLLKFSANPLASFLQRIYVFFKILPRYEIWHFNYATTFFFYPVNLLILKLCGKKIVCTFRGSEVLSGLDFMPSRSIINNVKFSWPEWYRTLVNLSFFIKFKMKLRIKVFRWLSDKIILTGPFLISSVGKYDEIIPYGRDITQIQFNSLGKNQRKALRILHAPSRDETKGTDEVIKIFKKLSHEYPMHDFKILRALPHEELVEEMARADIVIDQLLVGWYGGQAVEAMALGKCVMSFINPVYLELMVFGRDLPIFNTNLWNLKNDLETLIKSPALRQKLGERGLKFVKKFHSAQKIASQYLDIYEHACK